MTDTFQVQGDFAPADSTIAAADGADVAVHSAIDAVAAIAAAAVSAAATAPVTAAVSDEADDVAVNE